MRMSFKGMMLASIAILAACSQSAPPAAPAAEAAVAPAAAPAAPAALEMDAYKDLKAADLLKDKAFGKKFIAIVPKDSMSCVSHTLEQLRPLELDSFDNASSSADGSHADNWVEGYVQASPDGNLDVGVVCADYASAADKQILYFTTRGADADLEDGVKLWINNQTNGEGKVTVFDGKKQKDLAASALVGDLQENVAGALKVTVDEVAIEGDKYTAAGGELRLVSAEADGYGPKHLVFKGSRLGDLEDDFVDFQKAYRFADRDVVVLTHGCSGSACVFTSIVLVDITKQGQAKLLTNDKLSINTDGAVPVVTVQPDGSLLIAFTGFDGKEQWSFANGKISKA